MATGAPGIPRPGWRVRPTVHREARTSGSVLEAGLWSLGGEVTIRGLRERRWLTERVVPALLRVRSLVPHERRGILSESTKPKVSRRVWVRRIAVLGLGCLACEQLWRHGHDYIFPEKFATVEAGRIYRGAWQQDWPMRRIVREHGIKTIVALAHQPTHPLVGKEQALARELGCAWVHVPIVDDRTMADGEALFDRLEEAAAILAEPANQPVYFHCHHGINRASMVQMAYRMIHDGWTLEQATEEVSRTFGLRSVDRGPDYRSMAEFYEERVLPQRTGETAAVEPGNRASR